MEETVALSDDLLLYLRLERLMMDLDDRSSPIAERIRDLMDPVWYSLAEEDRKYLDSRGAVEVRTLYPVTLDVTDLLSEPLEEKTSFVTVTPQGGVGKRLSLEDDVLCPV